LASYLAGLRITKRNISATILADVKRFFHQINTDEVFGTHRCAPRLSLSPARSRHQVHPVLPSDHCIRPGRAARAARAQPEPECLCGALGQVGEGGVLVQGDPLWRALPALSEYVRHFHAERNHQGKGNALLFPRGTNIRRDRSVQCRERLDSCVITIRRQRERGSDEFFDLTRCATSVKEKGELRLLFFR
jgi:hypothetical protein